MSLGQPPTTFMSIFNSMNSYSTSQYLRCGKLIIIISIICGLSILPLLTDQKISRNTSMILYLSIFIPKLIRKIRSGRFYALPSSVYYHFDMYQACINAILRYQLYRYMTCDIFIKILVFLIRSTFRNIYERFGLVTALPPISAGQVFYRGQSTHVGTVCTLEPDLISFGSIDSFESARTTISV